MKLIDLVNSVIIFLSQTTSFYLLLRLLTFLLRSQDCDSHNRGLLDLLIYSHASICSTMVFSLGNSDVFSSQFPLTFCQTENGIARFIV